MANSLQKNQYANVLWTRWALNIWQVQSVSSVLFIKNMSRTSREWAKTHEVAWAQFLGASGILVQFTRQMLNFPPGGSGSLVEIHSRWGRLWWGLSLVNLSHSTLTCQAKHLLLYVHSRSIQLSKAKLLFFFNSMWSFCWWCFLFCFILF